MSEKWTAEKFAKHVIEGVGGLNDCEKHEFAVWPYDARVVAAMWTLQCLANPKCEGSAEALAAIQQKREEVDSE